MTTRWQVRTKILGPPVILLLLALTAGAAPPLLLIPAEIRPNGQYVKFAPETTCKSVVYVGLDKVEPLPQDLLRDGRIFLLDTRGLAAGRYRFAAVGAAADGEQARADFVIVIGDAPG